MRRLFLLDDGFETQPEGAGHDAAQRVAADLAAPSPFVTGT
jgi:hypothetical protein